MKRLFLPGNAHSFLRLCELRARRAVYAPTEHKQNGVMGHPGNWSERKRAAETQRLREAGRGEAERRRLVTFYAIGRGVDVYRALPMALLCSEYHQDTRTTAVVIYTDVAVFNRNFRACIKATANGEDIWATSFFKLRDADMAAFRRKSARKGWPRLREHD